MLLRLSVSCHDDSLPLLPTEWLLTLSRCPVVEARHSAARALAVIERTDNLMSQHVLPIITPLRMTHSFRQTQQGSLCQEVNKG